MTLALKNDAGLPLPERAAVWGEPEALSETEREPLLAPIPRGLKVIVILQLEFAATEAPQLLFWLYPVGTVMEVMVRVAAPVLDSVMTWGTEEFPTGREPKFRLGGEKVTLGVPEELTKAAALEAYTQDAVSHWA